MNIQIFVAFFVILSSLVICLYQAELAAIFSADREGGGYSFTSPPFLLSASSLLVHSALI
jgi:hypothetical protein